MRLCSSARIAAALLALVASGAAAQRIQIHAGALLDPATGRVTRNQIVMVENGRVTAVSGPVRGSTADSIIDLSRYTVLPGLIDAHVHLGIAGTPRDNALAILKAGFTTVLDLGARTTRILAIRDSINNGLIPGPRVLAAGIWVGRKDGVCEFNGIGIAGAASAFRARVRENVAAGANVTKVCVSGWPADAYAQPGNYELADSILWAVVDESHRAGRMVIAHDISLGGVQAALRTGVNGLAHAAYLDSATAQALHARGVFMIPTLASLLSSDTSAGSRALVAATALAHRSRVQLVFGTDGGVLPHGQNALEFAALTAAGIPALTALRSATVDAARVLAIADSVGTIAAGNSADLIAVEGDPLADVTALQRVRFVMLRGRVVKAQVIK